MLSNENVKVHERILKYNETKKLSIVNDFFIIGTFGNLSKKTKNHFDLISWFL
jgi:hypothetical protein